MQFSQITLRLFFLVKFVFALSSLNEIWN